MIRKLDNADVLYLTDKNHFGYVDYSDNSLPPIKISYLAICKYENDFSYYLFLLNEKMEVEQDDLCSTVEEALELGRSKNTSTKWNKQETTTLSTEELIESLGKTSDMLDFSKVCCGLSGKEVVASIQALVGCLKSKDCYKRRFALECIGKHKLFNLAINEIISSLADNSPYVTRTALDIINSHRIKEAHAAVLLLIISNDLYTKQTAFRALYKIVEPNDFQICVEAIAHESNHELKEIEANILFMTANECNWQAAYEMLKDQEYSKLRMMACELLVKFDACEHLALFRNDVDGHIRSLFLRNLDTRN